MDLIDCLTIAAIAPFFIHSVTRLTLGNKECIRHFYGGGLLPVIVAFAVAWPHLNKPVACLIFGIAVGILSHLASVRLWETRDHPSNY